MADAILEPATAAEEDEAKPAPLALLRCLFLLNALSTSSWGRFGQVYYLDQGLSTVQIGAIEGSMPLVGVVASSCWAVVADRCAAKKSVYLATTVCGTCALLLLAWDALLRRRFDRIFAVSLFMKLFSAGGILDAYALECVGGDRAAAAYGRLRLWGSVGWGGGALLMGFVNDEYGFGPNFVVFGGTNLLLVVALAAFVPAEATRAPGAKRPSFAALCRVFRSRALVAFVLEILVFGMAIGVVERLLFLYVVNDLGGDTTLCGLIVFVSSMFNIPVFVKSGALLKKLGHERLMILSQLCYCTRVAGYTFLRHETRYWILALETLHGFTFATLWIAAVERARVLAPEGWGASLQTLLQTAYYSVGPGCGALLGGWLWHVKNARFMYRVFATAVATLMVLRVVDVACRRRRAPKRPADYVALNGGADVSPLPT